MILKPLKYLLMLFLILVLLVLLVFSYLIYTEHGSRLAINFVLKHAAIDASYESISGTLADGLQLDQVNYQDETITVKLDNLEYQANWSLWNRFIDVSNMQVNHVELRIKQPEKADKNSQPFAGFQWPFALDIRHLTINDFTVHTTETSQNIQTINLQASASNHTTEVKNLKIEAPGWLVQSSGLINSKEGLNYQITPTIIAKTTEWQASSEGTVTGDLHQMQIKQQTVVNHPMINGQWLWDGHIKALLNDPWIDFKVTSADTTLQVNDQALVIKELSGVLTGQLEDLELTAESVISSGELPSAELIITGRGNTQQFQVQQAQLFTDEGALEFVGDTHWQDELQINGQLQLRAFNPAQLLPDWPGELNGTID
ncbi:MAG: hypothetical protein KDI92_15630, partial [Xanthomonadales bacterium]|nr:hypothetical protein [Xanthomonadales bacterium]